MTAGAAMPARETTMALYRELRVRGAAGFGEAATALGIGPDEADAHRGELGRLGLIHPLGEHDGPDGPDEPGGPRGEDTVTVVGPEVALRRLLARERQGLLARERESAALHAAVGDLAEHYLHDAAWLHADSPVEVEVVTDRQRINQVLVELTETTRVDESSLHPVEFQPGDRLRLSLERDVLAVQRGVRVRALYSRRLTRVPHMAEFFEQQAAAGVEVRLAPAVPITMIIADSRAALLPLDPDRPRDGLLVARGLSLVRSYAALYEYCWMTATPYEGSCAAAEERGPAGLTEQHLVILRMLAGGAKDERIARALGVSLRTVSRLLSELMQQLDASSRFEAGVRAARLGLLD
ncbi:LuxR C-terminal-related transcriptional regulator [Streptomyces sp. NPDC059002]|uniref:helix-turn-helix transcriptional regulator n=1 Tax=Streptomyces sp. NPDC059002 TaxID=3346690 RepID=UPI003698B60A